jgi:hypothetical protein
MKMVCKCVSVLFVSLLIAQPVFVHAGAPVRLIPSGNVSVLSDGKEVNTFQSEVPMPQGSLLLCNGTCLVQTQNLQLVAQDKAVFALADGKDGWDLTIKSGRIDFAMPAKAKPISFHTPQDVFKADRVVMPAETEVVARGHVSVTDAGTELAMESGSVQVASADGTQVIQAGQQVLLAKAGIDRKKEATVAAAAGVAGAGAAAGGGLLSSSGAAAGGAAVSTAAAGAKVAAGTKVAGGSKQKPKVEPFLSPY